uniref:Uncharacterized protein n=1 Tax=Cacopsylla melanoneura TaxID=428564 RepID=A0A8D8YCF8_9HEMI
MFVNEAMNALFLSFTRCSRIHPVVFAQQVIKLAYRISRAPLPTYLPIILSPHTSIHFTHSVSNSLAEPTNIIRYTVHQYSFEVQSRRKAGPKTKVSGDSLYPLLPNLHFSSFRHGLPFSC